jgi:drug/metabolite transporter (DMT)-like permease
MKGKYYLLTLAAIVIWSTSFAATKIAYASFSPLLLGCLRFLIASAILGPAMLRERGRRIPERGDLARIALSGFLGITLYFALENVGLSMTSASTAAMVVAIYPVITLLIEAAWRKARVEPIKLLGAGLALAGVVALTAFQPAGVGESAWPVAGIGLFILAGVVWTFYNLVTGTVIVKYPPATVSFYQSLVGCVLFIPLAALEGSRTAAPSTAALLALLYLGALCSVVAFMLYNTGLRKVSSSASVAMMNQETKKR